MSGCYRSINHIGLGAAFRNIFSLSRHFRFIEVHISCQLFFNIFSLNLILIHPVNEKIRKGRDFDKSSFTDVYLNPSSLKGDRLTWSILFLLTTSGIAGQVKIKVLDECTSKQMCLSLYYYIRRDSSFVWFSISNLNSKMLKMIKLVATHSEVFLMKNNYGLLINWLKLICIRKFLT